MIEVVWHGRGGQGAFTAARILGIAATLYSDKFALAFPTFGPERRGAPVLGFTKINNTRISDRSETEMADFRIYLDDTLLTTGSGYSLKDSGKILVNTPLVSIPDKCAPKAICIDATALAVNILGKPIVNTAMLGALAAIQIGISLEALTNAIRHELQSSIAEKNVLLLNETYNLTKKVLND